MFHFSTALSVADSDEPRRVLTSFLSENHRQPFLSDPEYHIGTPLSFVKFLLHAILLGMQSELNSILTTKVN